MHNCNTLEPASPAHSWEVSATAQAWTEYVCTACKLQKVEWTNGEIMFVDPKDSK